MRKGWEYKKLGEVCTIKAGYTPQKNELSDNGAYPYYKVADMNTLGNDVYLDITSSYKIDANKLFPKGAIVFPKNGAAVSTNKKRILKYDSIVDLNTGVAIFPKSINEKFAYYWFIDTDFKKYVRGGALPTLDIKSLKDKPFPSIDKSIQLAIVSELDKINELIRLKKEQLKDFGNLAQSLFYEMFGDPVENEKGWEVKKIGDLALVKTGPFGSMLHKEDYICDGIPLVNPVHMKDFKIVPDLDFTISKEKASELENYLLKSNDVVFARRGDIGRCAIVSEAEQGFICGTGSLFVRFSKEIESIFIMYIIRCDSFSKHLISKAKGATMLNINSNTIADLRIPLPPLSLQRLFAQRIEQIEREKSEVQKSIQDLETLLASRMQCWFE